MKFDLATLRSKKIDLAALRGMKFDPQSLRQQAIKLKEKLQNRSVVAITLFGGESSVRLVKREGPVLNHGPRLVLPLGADTLVSQPETFATELTALLKDSNIKEKHCVVCVPPAWAFTQSTDVPEISDEDMRGYLELRAEKEFPLPLSELRLAHSVVVLPDGKRRVTIAAIPSKRIAAVEEMIEKAGCKLLSLSLGLDYLLSTPEAAAKVHFLANGRHVDVIITAGGGVAGVRTLPIPVPPPDPAFDAVTFCREVRIMLGRLPEGLRQGVAEVSFGGKGDSADSLCEKTRDLLTRMGLATPHAPEHPMPAVGLEAAERFLREQPATFEFVTPEVKKWQEWLQKVDSKRRRAVLGGVIAAIVLPILAFMIRSHIESSLEEEWKGMQRNVAVVDSLKTKINRFRPWFDPTPQTLNALEALASSFSDNGDTWAKSIQVHDGQRITCTGYAKSQGAKDEMIGRLRKKPGIYDVQLQQVRGVSPIIFTFTYKWDPTRAN